MTEYLVGGLVGFGIGTAFQRLVLDNALNHMNPQICRYCQWKKIHEWRWEVWKARQEEKRTEMAKKNRTRKKPGASSKASKQPQAIYEVEGLFAGKPAPEVVQVSFSLSGRGWCRLQQSETWLHLLEVLEALQKEVDRDGKEK